MREIRKKRDDAEKFHIREGAEKVLSAQHIHRFYIHIFNQLKMKDTKKKSSICTEHV